MPSVQVVCIYLWAMGAPVWDKKLSKMLSKGKVANAGAVLASYYASRLSAKAVHRGLPISIGLEPTTSCNLRCPECPSGLRSFTRPRGMMNTDLMRQIAEEGRRHLAWVNFYFQGEPFLNPDFLDLVDIASEAGIYTSTSTNAHYFTNEVAERTVRSGLDRLIISIDGTDQSTYAAYRRGGSLEKVIEGTAAVLRHRHALGFGPRVLFQFLVVKPNEHQVADVKALAKKIGVDGVLIKTAQINDFSDGSPLIPSIDAYSRYRQNEFGKWEIKNPLNNHCWRMWSGCVVTWDGRVVPCCFDKDARHEVGKIGQQSLAEIWNGEAYRSFRAAVLRGRNQIEMCTNCSEGTRVWA